MRSGALSDNCKDRWPACFVLDGSPEQLCSLKYALNAREVKSIVMQRLIKVDGKVRTDPTYPAGFNAGNPADPHYQWSSLDATVRKLAAAYDHERGGDGVKSAPSEKVSAGPEAG